MRIEADGEKGVIPIYVGEGSANLKYPPHVGTSCQAIKDLNWIIDEKTEKYLDKKGPLHWMTSKIGRTKITNPDWKGWSDITLCIKVKIENVKKTRNWKKITAGRMKRGKKKRSYREVW